MAPQPPPASADSAKLDHIEVAGLSDTARAQLLASLPVQEGGEWNSQTFTAVREAVSRFDSHLTVGLRSVNGELTLHIGVLNAVALPANGIGFGAAGAVPPALPDVCRGAFTALEMALRRRRC